MHDYLTSSVYNPMQVPIQCAMQIVDLNGRVSHGARIQKLAGM